MPDKSYLYYAAVIAWAIAVVWRVYHHDKYEKEPWWMLLLAMAVGFVVMLSLEQVELGVLHLLGYGSGFAWKLALAAALVEDFARLVLIVLWTRSFHRWFNDPLDGMIYGMLIGIGMAAAESFDHLRGVPAIDAEVVCGEVFRFVGHCFLGGIVGFAIIEATPDTRPKLRPLRLAWCFLAAALPHFVIDFAAESPQHGMFARFGVAAGFTLTFLLWSLMMLIAGRASYAMFGQDPQARLPTRSTTGSSA